MGSGKQDATPGTRPPPPEPTQRPTPHPSRFAWRLPRRSRGRSARLRRPGPAAKKERNASRRRALDDRTSKPLRFGKTGSAKARRRGAFCGGESRMRRCFAQTQLNALPPSSVIPARAPTSARVRRGGGERNGPHIGYCPGDYQPRRASNASVPPEEPPVARHQPSGQPTVGGDALINDVVAVDILGPRELEGLVARRRPERDT
jgi:hypothetical protein